MAEKLKPIKARMVIAGDVEIGGMDRKSMLVLQAEGDNWRVAAGVYYVVPEAAWNRRFDPRIEKEREARLILEDAWRVDTEADGRGEPPAAAAMRLGIKDALALLGEVE